MGPYGSGWVGLARAGQGRTEQGRAKTGQAMVRPYTSLALVL